MQRRLSTAPTGDHSRRREVTKAVISRSAPSNLSSVIAIVPHQNSNRVHFLFMTATVRSGCEPCWQPATSLTQPYVSDTPITLLEIKTAFGPEDTAAMTVAFEEALKRLNVADREAHMATSVAKRIIRLAKRGERNPARLTEGVISSFRAKPIPI